MALPGGTRCVLLDIEGTTTPIAFVYATLLPYARVRLAEYCGRADRDERIAHAVEQLRQEHRCEPGDVPPFGDGAGYAGLLMERDRKSTGLKALQGVIWEEGYLGGTLRSEVFADVPLALRAWSEAGLRTRIYSSGSVLAQKLLFAHTDHGHLGGFIEGYYDTTTGPKKHASSYRLIAEDVDEAPERFLFLSDSRAELDAAAEAGLRAGLMRRPGNPATEPGPHPAHDDFLGLLP